MQFSEIILALIIIILINIINYNYHFNLKYYTDFFRGIDTLFREIKFSVILLDLFIHSL